MKAIQKVKRIFAVMFIIALVGEEYSCPLVESKTNVYLSENEEQEIQVGNFTYKISDGYACLTKYDGDEKDVIVPSEVGAGLCVLWQQDDGDAYVVRGNLYNGNNTSM